MDVRETVGVVADTASTRMRTAALLRELHDDQLMDMLVVYSRGDRTLEESRTCDQIAWEFHLRHRPDVVPSEAERLRDRADVESRES